MLNHQPPSILPHPELYHYLELNSTSVLPNHRSDPTLLTTAPTSLPSSSKLCLNTSVALPKSLDTLPTYQHRDSILLLDHRILTIALTRILTEILTNIPTSSELCNSSTRIPPHRTLTKTLIDILIPILTDMLMSMLTSPITGTITDNLPLPDPPPDSSVLPNQHRLRRSFR